MKWVNGKLVIAITCGLWLALMIGVSYFSYEYKPPVRIEIRKPELAR
jgi:hypothetical protein